MVGFVDAEGCFYVKITETKKRIVKLVFSISQHSRDFLLMSKIIKYLGCGVIEQPKGRSEVRYVVYKLSDHYEKIIPFFNKYNLQSIKLLSFNDYKKISNYIKNKNNMSKEDFLFIKNIKFFMNKRKVFLNVKGESI